MPLRGLDFGLSVMEAYLHFFSVNGVIIRAVEIHVIFLFIFINLIESLQCLWQDKIDGSDEWKEKLERR